MGDLPDKCIPEATAAAVGSSAAAMAVEGGKVFAKGPAI